MIHRIIKLPKKGSFFLLGPRQTGKSTLIHSQFKEAVWQADLLLHEVFLKYSKEPSLFRLEAEEKILRENIKTIFVDEIQRVPLLLNEIQSLMGKSDTQFILTGSSARKLKRGGANLLAGRAVERHLFPLTHEEIPDISLQDILHFGTLPPIIRRSVQEKIEILSTYTHVYLKEEIQSEGIARNLGGFSRFLDIAAYQCGELVSFTAIARECHLPVRTVQSYYEILEDTLIGFRLQSWNKSVRKRLVAHPKFYFFDTGVTNAINKRLTGELDRVVAGRLFEQFIILETMRQIHYKQSEANLFFWRTNHGAEVDLLIEKHGKLIAAIEIKSAKNISGADLSGLRAFRREHSETPCWIVSQVENNFEIERVRVVSWKSYLEGLEALL